MIDRIFEFALRQRAFVLLAAAMLAAVGIYSAARLPMDAVPDITNVQVQINTAVPSLAPEEIEKLVTYPIEIEMGGIQDLVEIRSLSKFGLSQVTLVFKEGTDIERARLRVTERLQKVMPELPPGTAPPQMAPVTTGLGEIYFYVLRYAEDAPNAAPTPESRLMELKLIQEFVVAPMLVGVEGVAEVNTAGGYDKEIVVFPDPQRLMSVGLTYDDLATAIERNMENAGGSVVEQAGENITIRSVGRVHSAEEIAQLPVKFGAGRLAILVKDVAEVGIGSRVRTGAAVYNGEEALIGTALMLHGENSRAVARRVHERIHEIRKRLPPGVEITTVYNRSDLVDRTIATVRNNLAEGAVLVIAVLLLLLGNIRAAVIVALIIPLSMLFAVTGMVQTRVSGNLMSLGAIDFGLIVDGAVVLAENIVRLFAQRQQQLGRALDRQERIATILEACRQVGRPMVFGVAIITIVYVPILSLTGVEGKTFKPMAQTVIYALLGALLLALTVVPALCCYLLTRRIREGDNVIVGLAKRIYAPVLEFAFRFRWLITAGAVLLFALSLFVFARMGAVFVPRLDEGSFAIQMIRTTSIGLNASVEMERRAQRLLLERFPEVSHVLSRIGTSEVAVDPMGVNVSDTYAMLRPPSEWRTVNGRRITKEELADLMNAELDTHLPGQAYLFSQPIELRFNELLSGIRADIAIKVFGEDYDVIERVAGEIREIVESIEGAADVEFDAAGRSPLFEVAMNREAMQRYNVHAGEVNEVVETAFAGKQAGTIIDGVYRYPVVIRLPEEARRNLSALARMPVRTADGGLISLEQVATMNISEQVNTISREAFRRRMAIMVNLRGRDTESFVREAQERIAAEVELPEGCFIEFGGNFRNLQEARARLAVVVPVALALIFVLIFTAFHSLRQAILVYTGIPLAVTGGIFALWLRDMPFSISAAIGFIALSGVAVLNGVVLISFFNQLREEGRSVAAAVREGAMTRLRPVLMTALVASLGFVPMALATSAGAEVQRPLATVVIGGIISSTFLTLILLPTWYEWMERGEGKKTSNIQHRTSNIQ
ncbi:MAG TPA: efflux RND transporter permease subunit [Verrucomicrobia bacterium]|nr:efflux RND transporter permease subunit [Verrucomicrobiota bacterium]HOB31597.1 CusA/CzcA family heavy metal efflux RND transporter [Verrucomicrobiota bacterium]HOP96347.1 CusA/CzcA family heavy metal efflux RND transporter [Verrucomicrobiota bacterium]HPU54940.1 CusA/CzcA family heavy metal efflux RND transporter [Verrucomicrobiota bacterium]